jgi:glutamate 5-kinase
MKQRIVIKVGTGSLLKGDERPRSTFETIANGVTELSDNYDTTLVSSGAIGFGVRQMGLEERPLHLPKLQALSAIGQVSLMSYWQKAFGDIKVAQVLLTARELGQAQPLETFKDTLTSLWGMGAVPIVNENDAITNEEISFGDNDQLAALVAAHIGADKLVMLTDQDGIQEHFGSTRQQNVRHISLADATHHVEATKTAFGTGGMTTKLAAARIALEHSMDAYIGSAVNPIADLLSGKSGTKIV